MWIILGIDPTDDRKAIKRAYARQLKQNHPEDDPEGFQRLHKAYQAALSGCDYGYASAIEEDVDIEEEDAVEAYEHQSFSEPDERQSVSRFQVDHQIDHALFEPLESKPGIVSLIEQLDGFSAKTPLKNWRNLFEKVSALTFPDKVFFEGELLSFLFRPIKWRRKIILATKMSPDFFSLVDEYFHWRENELTLLEDRISSQEHQNVFLNCLYRYAKPSASDLLNLLEALLSTPHKNTSHKNWRHFFRSADLLEQRKCHGLSQKSLKVLVAHFHTSGLALTPAVLSALDRLFGWTRSGFGHRRVRLIRTCRKELVDDAMALADLLAEARTHPIIYAPNAKYRKSIFHLVMTGFLRAFNWIWLSALLVAVLMSQMLPAVGFFFAFLYVLGFKRLKRMLLFG